MSNLTQGIYLIQKDTVKMAKQSLYGLHNKVNICNLMNRQMIVRALEYNNTLNVLSQTEIDFFEASLVSPTTCKTCNK